jgi:hypothetical protein
LLKNCCLLTIYNNFVETTVNFYLEMKKIFTTVLALTTALFVSNTANAQIANGSIAPDFTGTDLNGNTWNLYDLLDQGYSVVIDFSAAWCPPCWNYHNSGALEDLYVNHGPAGYSGVANGTTNDVMVLFIEGEGTNSLAQLQGVNAGNTYATASEGDWITGTPYPIIDNASFNSAYGISAFPTIYLVCPNRIITEVGQASTSNIYAAAQACPVATFPVDPAILSYTGETSSCSSIDLKAKLQNMGTAALTSATIKAYFNGNEIASYNWSGNLAKYAVTEVTVGQYTPTQNGSLQIKVTSTNDDVANDAVTTTIGPAVQAVNQYVTVKITTDAYGSETTWKLKKGNGQVVAQGGPYNDLQQAGSTVQTPVTVTLPAVDCYSFEITDSYGDGMCCNYGDGSYSVTDGAGTVLASGSEYTALDKKKFNVLVLGTEEEAPLNGNISIFPNPSAGNFNMNMSLVNKSNIAINVTNVMGQLVYSENKDNMAAGQHILNMDLSSLSNGMYMVNVFVGNKLYSQRISIAK